MRAKKLKKKRTELKEIGKRGFHRARYMGSLHSLVARGGYPRQISAPGHLARRVKASLYRLLLRTPYILYAWNRSCAESNPKKLPSEPTERSVALNIKQTSRPSQTVELLVREFGTLNSTMRYGATDGYFPRLREDPSCKRCVVYSWPLPSV